MNPDIVAIQEFNVSNSFGINTNSAFSNMVATTFGSGFSYFREPGSYSIPNGIISRYAILNSGTWVDSDTGVNDRGFAWAQIDLPGTNDLFVVSVHLKASNTSGPPSDASRRAAEAAELKNLIATNFPSNAWIIVAGDMNLYSDTEAAILTFNTFLSDSPVPADQNGDVDTNSSRSERYDRVLVSFSLTNRIVPIVMPSRTYTNGLVFDSRVYTPLSEVTPVLSADSGASGMQHMAVAKDFRYTIYDTNAVVIAPVITNQPQSLTVTQGNSASFSVTAGGSAPLTYQWRQNATNIPGANSASLTRSNVSPTQAGNYTVIVTNTAGSTTSVIATLTVFVAPTFSTPPQSLIVTQGSTANFTAIAAGNPLPGYQWRYSGTNLPGATNNSLSRPNAQLTNAGNYSVVITNAAGALTSSVVTLTVLAPPTITVQPQNTTVKQGATAAFSVTATGTATLNYQWLYAGTNLAGGSNSNLDLANVQPSQTGFYSVVIGNSVGSITSAPASLNLEIPTPTITLVTPGLLQWYGLSNLTYSVQGRTNVTQLNWSSLGTASSPSNSVWFTNSYSNAEFLMFRVSYP